MNPTATAASASAPKSKGSKPFQPLPKNAGLSEVKFAALGFS